MKSLRILVMITAALAMTGCGDDGGDCDVDSGPDAPVDQCINTADMAILASDGGDAATIATDCAKDTCLGELLGGDLVAATACMNTCMDGSSVSGLSDGCNDCYVNTALCGASQCAAECGFGTDMECDDCVAANCTPTFYECSGLTP